MPAMVRRMTVGVVTTLLALATWGPLEAHAAAESEGIVQLRRKLLAPESTGEPSEVTVDRAEVKIEEAPPLGEVKERKVPRVRRRPIRRIGKIDLAILGQEVGARFRDFELCRARVARVTERDLSKVKAGRISVRWTIVPDGGTRDTLVFEETDTDLALMKCARRRMNGWTFTPPTGGPVDVEYDYRFSSLDSGIDKKTPR
jgi:hypothetical protein